jgi:hypothetical protein
MKRAWIWLAVLAAACDRADTSGIENPTGTCQAPDSGARAGYHAPGDSQWLPDCQNPLRREYWRVFALDATTAYTIPRLDGAPQLKPLCTDPQHPLAPLTTRYPLCAPAMSQAEVSRINAMTPADALALTHFLHSQLRFVAGTASIAPFPPPTDIIDACKLHPNDTALTRMCDREADRLRSGVDIAFTYEGPAAVELAARLNELYGVK